MTGPLNVTANVTADDFFYSTPKRGHLGINGAGFIPSNSNWGASLKGYGFLGFPALPEEDFFNCDNECIVPVHPANESVGLTSHVSLPEQAVVTDFTCFWYDSDGPAEAVFTFELMKKPWFDLEATTMATVSQSTNEFGPANAVRFTTTDDVSESTIDNFLNSYYISGGWVRKGKVGGELRFYGCLIDYDLGLAGVR